MARTVADILRRVDDSVGHLFESGVTSVTDERFDGETALHIVAKWGDHEAIRILVAAGAAVNKPGEDQNTPLHYAAMMGHLDAAAALVQLGARCTNDQYGNTPSMLATEHPDVQRYLAEHGF
jgi:ankyrin repeat protein